MTVAACLAAVGTAGAADATERAGAEKLAVALPQRSYAPGDEATLVVWGRPGRLVARVFQAGPEQTRTQREDELRGVPRGPLVSGTGKTIEIRIPAGPSGLYFVRAASRGSVAYAPFVLRPRLLGRDRIAIVVPTNTWQAYNKRDVDGNGLGDTWYDDPSFNGVDLTRPYLQRGVPPGFNEYQRGFLRWLWRKGVRADFLSDDDLDRLGGGWLARHYDLVVFSGHEEYVSEHVWDATVQYRDRGGNIAFLSANNFFYRVRRRGNRLFRTGRWRDLGRSEAALKGVRYVGYTHGTYPNRPFVVTGARRAPWLFTGTGLHNGDRFGRYGIEVDQRAPDSPRGTIVLARIPDIFGPGRSAEMTFYETSVGAKVFSAGAMNFCGSAEWPVAGRLLDNLWRRLSRP